MRAPVLLRSLLLPTLVMPGPVASGLLVSSLAGADEPTVTVRVGQERRSFTRGELLARPDATTIQVARDVSYRVPMTYRAVPVAALLAGITIPHDNVLEAVALNGFVAQLPPDLLLNSDERKAVAWLAIEPADQPWPKERECGAVLHCVDRGRGRQHPQRAMAVSGRKTGERAFPRFALASTRGRFCASRKRSGPRRPSALHRAVPHLSQAEWGRCCRCRP